jgi:hypothetical protein
MFPQVVQTGGRRQPHHHVCGFRVTSELSAASAGGSGGASGVGLQNLVFGWSASALLAEIPLLVPLAAGAVVRVGAQTGFAVDDVAVLTDLGNMVFFQSKVGLRLHSAEDSPLAEALKQAVVQFRDGRVPQAGYDARHVDPGRDAIVLCTDTSAPATVSIDLARAVRRVASQPAGTPFGAELTKAQTKAINVALAHVDREWLACSNSEPSDEERRTFLKMLHVLTLDLEDGRNDQQSAISTLHRALPDPSRAPTAWTELVAEGQAAAEAREWRDRSTLALALSRHRIALNAPARHALDVDVLRGRSVANLHAMQAEARLPVPGGGLYISRSVAKTLGEATSREHVLIVGDAGSGKSAVAQDLATSRLADEEVVVLSALDLVGINRLQTNAPLQEVLRAWVGPPGLLVVDGVDALRGSEDRETVSGIVSALAGTRWQIVATARTFDTRYSQPLRRAFAGRPLTTEPSMVDQRLTDVRHLLVGDLTDDDLDREITAPMALASVLADASPDLRTLLRNPFNLRLAANLADGLTGSQHVELLRVRSRVELLSRYWEWRIRSHDRPAREALLKRLSCDMARRRSLQTAEEEPTILGTDSTALEDLLSQGVLRALDGAIPGVGRVLTFSHNILFDYATAIYVLYHPVDSAGLTNQLDADPTLPLVARPSFDLLVNMLWQTRSAGPFWQVALLVAGSQHDLASLAIASSIVNLVSDAHDLLELVAQPNESSTGTGPLPRQKLIGQIIGAVRARTILPSLSSAILPLATLARDLATNASSSYADGALATDLVRALQSRSPIAAEDSQLPGNDERADAIAALLDACRSDPRKMERIAGVVTQQLQYVMGFSREVREAVGRLLDDEAAVNQWGGTVLTWFPDAVASVLVSDPQLARKLAAISMTFEETRDEQVALGSSAILRLNESRQKEASHVADRLGEIFPQVCAKDVVTAAEIVCDILREGEPTSHPHQWPISAYGANGYVENGYGFSLSPYTNDNEQKMLAALSAALLGASVATARGAVRILVTRMHSAFGWAALMERPTDAASLGRILLPVLESGALLAHPDTFSRAATLLKAVAQADTVSSAEIEAAVEKAIDLADANGRTEHVKDVLVGCLGDSGIGNVGLARRRERLGETPPEIPPPTAILTEWTAWSLVDDLKKKGVALTEEVESAARALDAVLNEAQNGSRRTPETIGRLITAFMTASEAFGEAESMPSRLQLLLVSAAASLAYANATTPDSPHGTAVLMVLTDAAEDPDAGSFQE